MECGRVLLRSTSPRWRPGPDPQCEEGGPRGAARPAVVGCPGLQSGGKRGIAVVRSDSKPEHDAADGDDGDVIAQRLLVACGEAAGLLWQVEGALRRRPGLVQRPVRNGGGLSLLPPVSLWLR